MASAGFLLGKLRLREVLVGKVALFHSLIFSKSFYGLMVHERSLLLLHFTPDVMRIRLPSQYLTV